MKQNTKIHAGWRLTLFLYCTLPECNVGTQAADTIYTKKVLRSSLKRPSSPQEETINSPTKALANAITGDPKTTTVHIYVRSNNIDALVPPPSSRWSQGAFRKPLQLPRSAVRRDPNRPPQSPRQGFTQHRTALTYAEYMKPPTTHTQACHILHRTSMSLLLSP